MKRVILALDVPEIDDAINLINQLGDEIDFYKIGLELLMTGEYFYILDYLKLKNKKVFVDLKLFDIPETVGKAVSRLQEYQPDLITVHGNDKILQKAIENKGNSKILSVTSLTSLDNEDIRDLGFDCNVTDLVVSRAKRAVNLGCDGIVSSGLELVRVREAVGDKLIIVTPGIRPVFNDDDQKRIMTPVEAIKAGSDYLVIGRPITKAKDPLKAAIEINESIDYGIKC